ncbi:HAMP domain-containing sensor histidine kinase [Nocardioides sp. YIM 152588]|uniref:sensor histidine kinase n=1 Tax=Nocardioides sp. YIM 152588 TaxID=3158259 RepID=UPI0032E456FC
MNRPALSLTGRLTAAIGGVALATLLLAGAMLVPLVGTATEQAVRAPLARQADTLARLPLGADSVRGNALLARADLTVGRVGAEGAATGAAEALDAEERAALLAGAAVSGTGEYAGTTILFEARPVRGGGGIVVAADAAAVDGAVTRLRRRLVLAGMVALLGAVTVGWLLARQVGRPVAGAATIARRLAAGERGVAHPAAAGPPEVQQLQVALGELDGALAHGEAREREFLLSVSHELRTPLTAIRGYAEALADGVVGPEEVAEVGATLRAESERLGRYVADLLALARLQAAEFQVAPVKTDLGALVAEAGRAWATTAATSGVRVAAEPTGPLPARTDPDRVRQVVDTLVDNAVRVLAAEQTPAPLVVLAARGAPDDSGEVVVEVRDNGPGIPEAEWDAAFQPGILHARAPAARTGAQGLGLAIAHRLALRLGGTLAVDRAPEGGARFTLTLPGG